MEHEHITWEHSERTRPSKRTLIEKYSWVMRPLCSDSGYPAVWNFGLNRLLPGMSSRRLTAAAKKSTTKIANTIFTAPNIAFTKAMNKWNKGGETPLWRCSFYRPFQCFLLLSSFQRRWAYYSTFTAGAGAELHRKCGGFAPLVDEHTEQMDAPPYGRAVSDAPPHSGLSPIAVFRHYCSRLT